MRLIIAALIVLLGSAFLHADELEDAFRNPTGTAKPLVWWHWINGNVSKTGITKDLEAMKRVGIGGATQFNVAGGTQAGPVKFMSPEWLELVKFSAEECSRLGLEFGIHNCPGWSSSGGPWNTPEHGMKTVVTSERQVAGPVRFAGVLPTPDTPIGHYKDIAVLAFRTPACEQSRMADVSPRVTAGDPAAPTPAVADGKRDTFVELPRPTPQAPQVIEIQFDKPFAASELSITPGSDVRGCGGEILAFDDGKTFRVVSSFTIAPRDDGKMVDQPCLFAFPPTTARAYRVSFNKITGIAKRLTVAEVELSRRASISNFNGKAFYDRNGSYAADESAAKPEDVVTLNDTIDLTASLSSDGRLTWDVPAGEWTILRVGYAPNGRTNHPTPRGGEGPECDKLSAAALDAHWAAMVTPLMQKLGPLAGGKVFDHVVLDSYEVGTQNWTEGFRDDFVKRRGYDPVKHLAALSRRIVDNNEVTERFLWDVRRTVADLFLQNYAGRMAALAHRDGLTLGVEPYGDAPADDIEYSAPADAPMTEFWVVKELDNCTRLAASVAHTNGRRIVGCEAFTAGELGGNRWNTDPFALKAVGDLILASGANRFSLHSYVHQPFDRAPGIALGAVGSQFNRHNTWWDVAGPWITYLSRMQAMLQQGLPVADVLYYAGEDVPSPKYGDGVRNPGVPAGYAYDGCSADVLLNRVSVKDGRLVLPDGVSYRLLVLPNKPAMRPEILQKIRQLVDAGATVIGPRPQKSPGLRDYPRADEQVGRTVDALWGPSADGVRDVSPAVAIESLGLKPDFGFAGDGSRLVYDHRRVGDADVYFVSNQRQIAEFVNCTFRVAGKVPELWHADTGVIETAPVYREHDGRTTVSLPFDPCGSVFVVFRKPAGGADHIVSVEQSTGDASRPPPLKIVKARFVNLNNPALASFDVTEKIAGLVKDGSLAVRVGDELGPKDHGISGIKGLIVEYEYDGLRRTVRGMHDRMLELPLADDVVQVPPAFELAVSGAQTQLLAWHNGTFTARTAAGKAIEKKVDGMPSPVEITGPWEVQFPPDRGAPEKVTLDKLISWTDHAEQGVRFFSGTATYLKEFDVTEGLMPGRGASSPSSLYIDLGRVKNLARVSVNGKDLGVLWKPPYRVDVSSAVKPGTNRLEVRVTNLWQNRLIGDQQLPDDSKWAGDNVASWPDWMTAGRPSPTGRVAFTSRRHWRKDDEPLPSGLLGPVMLRAVVTRTLLP
jgi:hypothetical protein